MVSAKGWRSIWKSQKKITIDLCNQD